MFLKIFSGKKKIISIIFALFFNLLVIFPVFAAAGDYTPLVKIPGVSANAGLFSYLSGVYSFLISIVGILAMAVLVYGGMRYVTSAGNPASVEEAKDSINSALVGLLLALVSWLIFATINKDILVLKPVGVGLPTSAYGNAGKTFSCAMPTGNGTPDATCTCLDGAKVYSSKKTVILTLFVDTNYNATGKLTDQSGVGVAGKTIKFIWGDPVLGSNTSLINPTTGADGSYSYNPLRSKCSGTEIWQAHFDGDATYGSVYSNIAVLTVMPSGSYTPCTATNYGGSYIEPTILSGSVCEQVCSNKSLANDGRYHCIKADLRVGRGLFTECDNSINDTTAIVRSCESLSWNASNSVSKNPIASYEVVINNNSTACLFPSDCDGFMIKADWTAIGCGLRAGSNDIKLKITDNAGNVSENARVFTVEGPPNTCQ